MRLKILSSCLLTAAIAATTFTTGCTVHAGYYDDPYYHDRHPVNGEVEFYGQWEHETHRDHQDLNKRKKDEQKEYWDWRHKHQDPH